MKCRNCGSKDTGFKMIEKTRINKLGNERHYYGKKHFCRQCDWGKY